MASLAGGLAEGFNSTFNTTRRSVDRRSALAQQAQQAFQANAAARIKQNTDIINNIATAFAQAQAQQDRDPGTVAAQGSALSEMLAQSQALLGSDLFKAGLADSEQQGQQRAQLIIQAALQEQRNANFIQSEQQRVETQGAVAQQQALLPGNVEQAGQVAEARAAGTRAGQGEDFGPIVNFADQQGNIIGSARRDSPEAQAFIQGGNVVFSAALQGGQGEVFGIPITERDASKAAGAAIRSAADVAKAARALEDITAAGPGVVGTRAILGDVVGGFLGQINSALGDAASGAITGVDQETLGRLRANAQSVARSLIGAFTGEEGRTRITKSEQDTVDRVSRIVDSPGSSFEQVQGAIGEAILLQLLVTDREAFRAKQTAFPLETDDDINAFGELLEEKLRLPRPMALRIFSAIKSQRDAIQGLVVE